MFLIDFFFAVFSICMTEIQKNHVLLMDFSNYTCIQIQSSGSDTLTPNT